MNEGPDKGASLSAVRAASVRNRWRRDNFQIKVPTLNGHPVTPPPAPAPITVEPAPARKPAKPKPPKPTTPKVPYDEIAAAYMEAMPNNPAVRLMGETTKSYIKARWEEDPERQNIEWWKQYFRYCNTCPLLAGKVPRRDSPPWFADLQWLVRPTNMEKVINGNYQ